MLLKKVVPSKHFSAAVFPRGDSAENLHKLITEIALEDHIPLAAISLPQSFVVFPDPHPVWQQPTVGQVTKALEINITKMLGNGTPYAQGVPLVDVLFLKIPSTDVAGMALDYRNRNGEVSYSGESFLITTTGIHQGLGVTLHRHLRGNIDTLLGNGPLPCAATFGYAVSRKMHDVFAEIAFYRNKEEEKK